MEQNENCKNIHKVCHQFLDRGANAVPWRKGHFKCTVLEQFEIHVQKYRQILLLSQTQLKMDHRLKYKAQTYNTSRRWHSRKVCMTLSLVKTFKV